MARRSPSLHGSAALAGHFDARADRSVARVGGPGEAPGMRLSLPAVGLAALIALASPRARALDPFEIQVYDGTANAPGAFGLELHLNHVATGHASATSPELPLLGQTHATLEPSYGLFPWWELGAYLQTSLRADGRFDYAGVKLRSKFVTPPSLLLHLRFGLNLEVSYLPEIYDRDRWGAELRPIAAWEGNGWLAVVNPILDFSLAGPDASAGPSFEPAAKIAHTFVEVFALGAEYYGSLGPIASPLPLSAQSHELFGVIDLEALPALELELGLGGGFTPASAGLVGKIIVGYTFDLRKAAPDKSLPR